MIVQATTDGNRILVRFPYSVRLVDAIHKVPGSRWNKETKTWRCPLTMDTCRVLRRVFADQLEVMPALSAWFRAEVERERELDAMRTGNAELAGKQLDRVAAETPALFAALNDRPYQLNGAAFIGNGRNVLLGDQPGLGKTLQALAALVQADAQGILVACPRTTAGTVWEREIRRWLPNAAVFVAQGSRAERKAAMRAYADTPAFGQFRKFLVVNTEMLRVKKGDPDEPQWPFLHSSTWDAIVVDESHQALASTKNVQSAGITQVRYGAMQIRRRLNPGGIALAMSGTPFRSDLAKAWGTMNWLRPDVFTSYWNFAKAHFQVDSNGYGMTVGSEPLDPAAFASALRPYYLARDKATAAPDLPPITYAGTPLPGDGPNGPCYVQIDMEPEQARAYEEMRKLAAAAIEGGNLLATGVLAEITRLRQFALSSGRLNADHEFEPTLPSAKFEWILEFLKERAGNDGKVVIASNFTSWIKVLATALEEAGFPVMTLTGETSDKDRAYIVERFADPRDAVRIVIINTKAGGVGITLDAADDMIITDLPWKSDDERQVIDRIHRVSRVHNVTVYRLLSADTVDIWMAGLTDEQRRILASSEAAENRATIEGALR
jgi:SNF2 family DNA or RNA helicase